MKNRRWPRLAALRDVASNTRQHTSVPSSIGLILVCDSASAHLFATLLSRRVPSSINPAPPMAWLFPVTCNLFPVTPGALKNGAVQGVPIFEFDEVSRFFRGTFAGEISLVSVFLGRFGSQKIVSSPQFLTSSASYSKSKGMKQKPVSRCGTPSSSSMSDGDARGRPMPTRAPVNARYARLAAVFCHVYSSPCVLFPMCHR